MLFAPPRPPVWVPHDRSVVIGRGSDCDLTLPTREASRHHAEVRFEGDEVVIEDLGSTNGTFVNGEILEAKHVLSPGDRIHIGGVEITCYHMDADLATAEACLGGDDSATLIFKGPLVRPPQDAFRGDLSEIPAAAVLQVLEVGAKTGALGILTGPDTSRIWLDAGRPVHAEDAEDEGPEAAFRICRLTRGSFTFEPGAEPPTRSLSMSLVELLLESSRRYDESLSG